MDNKFAGDLYAWLRAETQEIVPMIDAIEALDADVRSGKYADRVNDDMRLRMREIERDISDKADEVIREAHARVDARRADIQRENELRGEDLTDDVRLLGCGIKLTEADIAGMLRRNAGNRTMEQVISRYAAENGIPTDGFVYVNSMAEHIDTLANLDNTIAYFRRWIDKRNNLEMLDKFFGVK